MLTWAYLCLHARLPTISAKCSGPAVLYAQDATTALSTS